VSVVDLSREGPVFVLHWSDGENRFQDESIRGWNAALDEVERAEGPKALVTTGAGKFYSNGLDLDWAFRERKDSFPDYICEVLAIIGRVLTLPCTTVAAGNGHAFGAGALLFVAHDFRLMRADRGFFCMPEIDMRAFLHPGMTAVLAARLPAQTAHEVIATGRRYGGGDARAAGIVEEALAEAELLPRAVELAGSLSRKAHPVMKRLKADLYPHVLAALTVRLALEGGSNV
jgi:enoyl-CoA hydratase/carnithine racemase